MVLSASVHALEYTLSLVIHSAVNLCTYHVPCSVLSTGHMVVTWADRALLSGRLFDFELLEQGLAFALRLQHAGGWFSIDRY